VNPVRRAEDANHFCSAATLADEGEVARFRFAASLAIEQQRRPRDEVRLADEVLTSSRELDY
jgi:hypothetical protein